MATRTSSQGILSDDNAQKREEIIELLTKAYWMEIETVMTSNGPYERQLTLAEPPDG